MPYSEDRASGLVRKFQICLARFAHRLWPGTSPHALRIPFCDDLLDGHLALRSTTSGGFRCVLAVSSFRLRARLDIPIPSTFSGQSGFEPRFGYSAPHLSARRTSTLLNNALLSPLPNCRQTGANGLVNNWAVIGTHQRPRDLRSRPSVEMNPVTRRGSIPRLAISLKLLLRDSSKARTRRVG